MATKEMKFYEYSDKRSAKHFITIEQKPETVQYIESNAARMGVSVQTVVDAMITAQYNSIKSGVRTEKAPMDKTTYELRKQLELAQYRTADEVIEWRGYRFSAGAAAEALKHLNGQFSKPSKKQLLLFEAEIAADAAPVEDIEAAVVAHFEDLAANAPAEDGTEAAEVETVTEDAPAEARKFRLYYINHSDKAVSRVVELIKADVEGSPLPVWIECREDDYGRKYGRTCYQLTDSICFRANAGYISEEYISPLTGGELSDWHKEHIDMFNNGMANIKAEIIATPAAQLNGTMWPNLAVVNAYTAAGMATEAAYLMAARERITKEREERRKTQEEEARRREEERRRQEAEEKARRIAETIKKFMENGEITGEDVVLLCDEEGIRINPRTRHNLLEVVTYFENNGNRAHYKTYGKRKPSLDGCFTVADSLYQLLKIKADESENAAPASPDFAEVLASDAAAMPLALPAITESAIIEQAARIKAAHEALKAEAEREQAAAVDAHFADLAAHDTPASEKTEPAQAPAKKRKELAEYHGAIVEVLGDGSDDNTAIIKIKGGARLRVEKNELQPTTAKKTALPDWLCVDGMFKEGEQRFIITRVGNTTFDAYDVNGNGCYCNGDINSLLHRLTAPGYSGHIVEPLCPEPTSANQKTAATDADVLATAARIRANYETMQADIEAEREQAAAAFAEAITAYCEELSRPEPLAWEPETIIVPFTPRAAEVEQQPRRRHRLNLRPRLSRWLHPARWVAVAFVVCLLSGLLLGMNTSTAAADDIAAVYELHPVTITAEAPDTFIEDEAPYLIEDKTPRLIEDKAPAPSPVKKLAAPSPVKNVAEAAECSSQKTDAADSPAGEKTASPMATATDAAGLTVCEGTPWAYTMMNRA